MACRCWPKNQNACVDKNRPSWNFIVIMSHCNMQTDYWHSVRFIRSWRCVNRMSNIFIARIDQKQTYEMCCAKVSPPTESCSFRLNSSFNLETISREKKCRFIDGCGHFRLVHLSLVDAGPLFDIFIVFVVFDPGYCHGHTISNEHMQRLAPNLSVPYDFRLKMTNRLPKRTDSSACLCLCVFAFGKTGEQFLCHVRYSVCIICGFELDSWVNS